MPEKVISGMVEEIISIVTTSSSEEEYEVEIDQIGGDDIKCLSEYLATNPPIKTLSLYSLHLSETDLKMLAEALTVNRSLECLELTNLDLADCPHLPKGIGHIFEALKVNTSLEELNLNGCDAFLEDDGNEAFDLLLDALEVNTTLESLSLPLTGLSIDQVKEIASVLETNETLRILDLSNNGYLSEDVDKAKEAVRLFGKNRSLTELYIKNKCEAKHCASFSKEKVKEILGAVEAITKRNERFASHEEKEYRAGVLQGIFASANSGASEEQGERPTKRRRLNDNSVENVMPSSPFAALPDEIIKEIASYVEPIVLQRAGRVCKATHAIGEEWRTSWAETVKKNASASAAERKH